MTTDKIKARADRAFEIWDRFLWTANCADPDFEKKLAFIGIWHMPGFRQILAYYESLDPEAREQLKRLAESEERNE